MENDDPSKSFETRTDKWLLGHEDKNGECASESAKPYYGKIKEANSKRKSGEVGGTTIESDAVTEVLGSDKRGRVRGMGSHVSIKQLMHLGVAQTKEVSRKEESDLVGKAMQDHIETCVNKAVQGAMSSVVVELKGCLREGSPHPSTPKSDFASNSFHQPLNLRNNVDNVFTKDPPVIPVVHNPSVILINEERQELAKGYVVTDSHAGVCHGKKVGYGQKKVFISEVLQPDAKLLYSQDGNDTFAAYTLGGYLVWMETWLVYI